jgi:hypothetical protein
VGCGGGEAGARRALPERVSITALHWFAWSPGAVQFGWAAASGAVGLFTPRTGRAQGTA